ncbi:uncharacterized protein LOC128953890 [Oppia nitens]|uniref:uncharacterized protein LOC128953890 n=1 Tax=Oppia nitens TaxID=1686743 RepID=UPI0023DC3133|nr:uncharacterized protein LOC128953890 [Oppia nitens]
MDIVQEVCGHLKTISRLMTTAANSNRKNDDQNYSSSTDETIDDVVERIGQLCRQLDDQFNNIYSIVAEDISLAMMTSMSINGDDDNDGQNKFKRRLWQLIDQLIKAVILLDTATQSDGEMISAPNYMTIKLSVIKLVSITIIPYISPHFQQIQHLFISIDSHCLSEQQSDSKQISREFIRQLTQLLAALLTTKSFVSKILIDDCLASLMASLMTLRNDSDSVDDRQTVNDQLMSLLSSMDQTLIIRNLLLLSRCKAVKWANNDISRCLSQCLTCDLGLVALINAVIDCDQTSEKQTTLNQRYQAVGTIVSAIPVLYCSLRDYYQLIGGQILRTLLLSCNQYHQTIGSIILTCLENRNKKLTQELIINKIVNIFEGTNGLLTLNNGIDIVNNLLNNRYDVKKFVPIVPHLFYCRVVLEESLSHYKTLLMNIMVEIMLAVKQSVYLLDNLLYNNCHLIKKFKKCVATDGTIGVQHQHKIINSIDTSFSNSCTKPELNDRVDDDRELDLKQCDSVVQFVLQLLAKLGDQFKMDLFSILIDRMSFQRPSLITCCLIDSIQEDVLQIINNYPQKAIGYVINTVERLADEQRMESVSYERTDNGVEDDGEENEKSFVLMKQNSLTICLQIVKILLKERNKLKAEDLNQLRQQLSPALDLLQRNERFDDSTRRLASDMKIQLLLLENNCQLFAENDGKSVDNEFETAMTELNDPLMPVRAHALIRLKRLIYANDRQLMDNRNQLINALKMCLNDSESYIYLSAVNTLSTLAIKCTDEVLPVLTQEFTDNERPVEDRIKVGEVLVRLSKSIGEFAHHYSKQYIHCFLTGVKSSAPAIRISSLSNLGQFCGALKHALNSYIVELMSCVEALLKTDPYIEVKRSAVMLLCLMLRGIDSDVIGAVEQHLKEIYRLLRHIYSTTIDDILQIHSQLAIDEIDRIARDLFRPNNTSLVRNIQVL